MSRTELEDAIARDFHDQAGDAPTGAVVASRVRARTVEASTRSRLLSTRGRLVPLLAAAAIIVVVGGLALVADQLGARKPATSTVGAPPAAPPCRLTDLTVTMDAGQPPGHFLSESGVIQFRNTSATTCSLDGYPEVALSYEGTGLSAPARTLSGPLGGVIGLGAPPVVTLASGDTASAMIESDERRAPPTVDCTDSEHIDVSLAAGDQPVSLGFAVYLCAVEVHPIVEGETGTLDAASAAPGVSFPFELFTHCGIRFAELYHRTWEAETPLPDPTITVDPSTSILDYHVPGYTLGTMTVVDPDTLKFTVTDPSNSLHGQVVIFHPTTAPVPGCLVTGVGR